MSRYADVTPQRDTEAHGYADQHSIVTCQCGAVFEGDHEAEALTLWAEHCEQEEP